MAQVEPGYDLAEEKWQEDQGGGQVIQVQPVAYSQYGIGKQGEVQQECNQQEFQASSHLPSILLRGYDPKAQTTQKKLILGIFPGHFGLWYQFTPIAAAGLFAKKLSPIESGLLTRFKAFSMLSSPFA